MASATPSLKGKVALITGSAKPNGVGAAIARALARDGAHVALHYHSSATRAGAEKIAATLKQDFGVAITVTQGDIGNKAATEAIVSQALEGLGVDHIDILINNSALTSATTLLDAELESLNTQFQTNVFGSIFMTQAVVKLGKMPKGGRVVNISSIVTKMAFSAVATYTAAKAAADACSACWAEELGKSHGITVNTVALGPTPTDGSAPYLLDEVISCAAGSAALWQYYVDGHILRAANAEAPEEEENPIIFEKSRKKPGASKEDNRDLISSQHHQVKRSWESPGLYAWGNNAGKVVAPQSTESVIKTPRRIPYFDGKLLRDVKLDRTVGVAIDEAGNLLEWGSGYAADATEPVQILKGKNLQALVLSRDRIVALARNGTVYSIPVSKTDQESGTKAWESSWIPFWSSRSPISYRTIQPTSLGYTERVASMAGGQEHVLLLTNAGRVFSAAAASDSYPARGQLGISGLSWHTRPEGDFDVPHEITTLKGFEVTKVVAGDYHSLALDKEGRLFSWGDNSAGQLGFDNTAESSLIDVPSLLSLQKLYSGTGQSAKITDVFAGGQNSYFTVDATTMPPMPGRQAPEQEQRLARSVGKVTSDTFSLGAGISGTLGNNRWTHIQSSPAKIPMLSGIFEYDEKDNKTVPIKLSYLSVGDKHVSAVMQNITYLSASPTSSSDDTNWGADIVFWGNNEFFQIGTGKRNNVSQPVYLQPLDIEAEEKRAKRSSGGREEHRFHITPRSTAVLGDGRRRSIEQRVECGRAVTCVYSQA